MDNGRFDQLQVEALSDLIRAETDWQLGQAMSHLEGNATRTYNEWRERLITALAYCEALIDFEEPSEDPQLEAKVNTILETVVRDMESHLAAAYLSKPLAVALLGPPNSGKSSLLNTMAREDIAIVSPTPGTTRDINRATLDISGLPVTLYDTAGLRKTQDPLELEGQRRALQTQQSALLRLCILDATELQPSVTHSDWYQWPKDLTVERPDLVVVNKRDLRKGGEKAWIEFGQGRVECLHTSCKTGEGITEVVGWLAIKLKQERPPDGTVLITRERHKQHISQCVSHLHLSLSPSKQLDLKSEDIREAVACIGRVTGRVDVEEVLDKVFSEFCIGK